MKVAGALFLQAGSPRLGQSGRQGSASSHAHILIPWECRLSPFPWTVDRSLHAGPRHHQFPFLLPQACPTHIDYKLIGQCPGLALMLGANNVDVTTGSGKDYQQ